MEPNSRSWYVLARMCIESSIAFLPYRLNGQEISIFLQKRTADAPTFPGLFLTFGGGVEPGEDPHTALLRELKEELNYRPKHERYVKALESPNHCEYIHIEHVRDDFEETIEVMEGEYGIFFTEQELFAEPKIPQSLKEAAPAVFDLIRSLHRTEE